MFLFLRDLLKIKFHRKQGVVLSFKQSILHWNSTCFLWGWKPYQNIIEVKGRYFSTDFNSLCIWSFVRSSYTKISKVKVNVRLDACFPLRLDVMDGCSCDYQRHTAWVMPHWGTRAGRLELFVSPCSHYWGHLQRIIPSAWLAPWRSPFFLFFFSSSAGYMGRPGELAFYYWYLS